jgi:GNAT superfamily N-acetyltransferase
MIIRRATAKDSAAVKNLLAQLGYPGLSDAETVQKIDDYSLDNYAILVGEIDGIVIGFIALHWFDIFHSPGKMGRITAFCTDENVRSKGLGTILLNAAEELVTSQGCTKLEVTSNARRTRTHQFYPRHGYVEDSKRFSKYPGKNS